MNASPSMIENEIIAALDKLGKPFITLNQVRDALPLATLKRLGLTRKSGGSQVMKALKGVVADRTRFYKGGRSHYIGLDRPLTDIIVAGIAEKPGASAGKLGGRMPMTKKEFIAHLNDLLRLRRVRAEISGSYGVLLFPEAEQPAKADAIPASADHRHRAFKQAYDTVGQGARFVRIHQIRNHLNWPREVFDAVLTDLRRDLAIQLHGGDPASLDPAALDDSYVDEKGRLRITVTWRSPHEL